MADWKKLTEPFPEKAIKQRVMHIAPKKGADGKYPKNAKGMLADYVDARDVEDRLDSCLGLADWRDEYRELPDGAMLCTLSLHRGDEWISKQGVGYPNNPGSKAETEPFKAAESDALKRAAVKFGIGRHLYDRETRWVEVDEYGRVKTQSGGSRDRNRDQAAPSSESASAVRGGAAPANHFTTQETAAEWLATVKEVAKQTSEDTEERVRLYLKHTGTSLKSLTKDVVLMGMEIARGEAEWNAEDQ